MEKKVTCSAKVMSTIQFNATQMPFLSRTYHFSNIGVDISRSFTILQTDWCGPTFVTPHSRVVLQPIARAILVHGEVIHVELRWDRMTQCSRQFTTTCQSLPWLLLFLPPSASLKERKKERERSEVGKLTIGAGRTIKWKRPFNLRRMVDPQNPRLRP